MNTTVATKVYARVEIESSVKGANPQELISMLYQGALLAIANAKNGILRKDIPAKGKAISHAMRIIDEGLQASLNKNVGGKLAHDLDALYGYMCFRLVDANLKNDIEALDEVSRLLNEIKGAWDSIGQQPMTSVSTLQQPPATMNKPVALVYGRH